MKELFNGTKLDKICFCVVFVILLVVCLRHPVVETKEVNPQALQKEAISCVQDDGYDLYVDNYLVVHPDSINIQSGEYTISIDNERECVYLETIE